MSVTYDAERRMPPPAQSIRAGFTASTHRVASVVRLLRREGRELRRKAEREGYVPPPGKRNRSLVQADDFERIAWELERVLPADARPSVIDRVRG